MKALYFDGSLRHVSDAPVPNPGSAEALVRVTLAGICRTDLEIIKGYMGFRGIPGHEFVGVVEECEDSSWVGKRVVGEINCPCLECPACRSGRGNHCPGRTVLGIKGRNGAFAEYLTLPPRNLHVLPDAIKDEQAVFVEPLAAAFEILEQTEITPEDRVIVVGDGRLGILVAQVLKTTRAHLTVIGHHAEKLSLLGKLGLHAMPEKDSAGLHGADIAVDCSGTPSGFETARRCVRPGGRLILKSTFASPVPVNLASVVVDEITLIGSRCGPFAPAMAALGRGDVDVAPMISAVYPLDQGVEAFARASLPGVLKVLLKVD